MFWGATSNQLNIPCQPKPFSLLTATRRTFSINTDEAGWGEGKEHLKTVTLIGRPNVGKSRLFNRFVGKRVAIVNDEPGTTRDFREAVGTIADLNFNIVDTAGLEDTTNSLTEEILYLTKEAIVRSNVILFLIDAKEGVTAIDEHYAKWLRKEGYKIKVVVNKLDGNLLEDDMIIHSINAECLKLGFGDPIFISGEHGHGISDLYTDLLEDLENAENESIADTQVGVPLQLAIVGKPNVGKSTLLNQLVDAQRVLTGPMAGVTRDPIRIDMAHPKDLKQEFNLLTRQGCAEC